jgi:hypothetical protein
MHHLDSIVKGSITIGSGFYETEVILDPSIVIKKVYASIEAEGPPVCVGNVDMVGIVKKDDHSFILYTDIKSNMATVYWLVEY